MTRAGRRPLVLLLGAALLVPPASACKRRIQDYLPSKKPTNEFEQELWDISKGLETCYEIRWGNRAEKAKKGEQALAAWPGFRAKYQQPDANVVVGPEDYALVMDSLGHYMQRIGAATKAGKLEDARVQSVAFQHVLGELYGNNPGRVSQLNAIIYTSETFTHIPSLAAEHLPAWETRLRLLRNRIAAWVKDGAVKEVPRLERYHTTLQAIDEVAALADLGKDLAEDAAPWPALAYHGEAARKAGKEVTRKIHYLKAALASLQWNPKHLPRYLQRDDPEYDPKAR